MLCSAGENMLWQDWGFPIFLIQDENITESLYQCYHTYNRWAGSLQVRGLSNNKKNPPKNPPQSLFLPYFFQNNFIIPVLWIRNYFFRIRIRLFRKFRIQIRIRFRIRIRPNLSVKRQNQNIKLKLQH